jgi:hypothetical protein
MRFAVNEVYAVKHAVLIVLETGGSKKRSPARSFIISYPSEILPGVGHKLNLREAGIRQPMFVLKNLDDSPCDIMRRVAEVEAQGHVMYEAAIPRDACAACEQGLGLYDADQTVYAIDPRMEHRDLLDILRECEAC